uniref:Protein quiver n=1 Tax=Glossina palpalis gambiensis TaxID=67801 RepID=A0A1B0AUN0_9MUSC
MRLCTKLVLHRLKGSHVQIGRVITHTCKYMTQEILRCWRCSTDVSNGEFCNDPFNPNSISDQQRYWSYVNCTYSAGVKSVNARPVCKKLVQEGKCKLMFVIKKYLKAHM